ncbi:MAG: 3'-5' exoribonuclease YhaM family protein [Thermoleophilia bacterium]
MKTMVKQLEPGQKVTGFFVCAGKIVKVDRNNNRYMDLRLSDASGVISGKMWDVNDSDIGRFCAHDVVKVLAVVTSGFRGAPELKVERIRAAAPEDEFDLEELLPSSPRELAEMEAELAAIRASIANPYLAALLDEIFNEEMYHDFCQAPAAKGFHHNYIHGLLEHTVSVCRVADAIAGQYPEINRDLLVTAAILHDIGKTVEFDYSTAIDYSDSGRLLGHIVLGEKMVADAIARLVDFPAELMLQLLHLVLSHHGEKEYGSPIRPKTPEAFLLNHADDIDAKANVFQRKRADSDEPWSEFNRPLDRFLYLRKAED